jgi:hypothetical protein
VTYACLTCFIRLNSGKFEGAVLGLVLAYKSFHESKFDSDAQTGVDSAILLSDMPAMSVAALLPEVVWEQAVGGVEPAGHEMARAMCSCIASKFICPFHWRKQDKISASKHTTGKQQASQVRHMQSRPDMGSIPVEEYIDPFKGLDINLQDLEFSHEVWSL